MTVLPSKLRKHCTAKDLAARGSVRLPVLGGGASEARGGGGIRRSKSGRRRAIVLIIVQLLMIAHLVQWWIQGRTTTPIEPSESMQFVTEGVINAGLIFFAVALLATLILGRWFCGWGCHIVMLQDFCGWIMKKAGIHPKPFRSRLLMLVPLLLALYMFVWPAVFRWGVVPLDRWAATSLGPDSALVSGARTAAGWFDIQLGHTPSPWNPSTHFIVDRNRTDPATGRREDFWATFPSPWVAAPFLLICGFATVYFLGAKGFCTYGCPYGGFFAPLDKFALGRIIVTDACEHCGHCTAVCTSNVRVHEEVREYGMVVDPGCMKCLDCVSVCPNDALYFGFAKPSIMKGAAKHATPKRNWDLSWPEELAMAGVFAASFFAVRGPVPLLMAAGVAGVVTYLIWKLWRLVRDESVNLHRFRLKYKGALQRSGFIFAAAAVLAVVLTAHTGVVKGLQFIGQRYDNRVTIPAQYVFGEDTLDLPADMAVDARRAIEFYRLASSIPEGGIGLAETNQTRLDHRMVWLHSTLHEFDQADRILRGAVERDGMTEPLASSLAMVNRSRRAAIETSAFYARVLADHPEYERLQDEYVTWLEQMQDTAKALEVARAALLRMPDSLLTMRRLSLLETNYGDLERGIELTKRTIEIDPSNSYAHLHLAMSYGRKGDSAAALAPMHQAVALAPDDPAINEAMAALLYELQRPMEAGPYERKAAELREAQTAAARQQP